jgi:hypothetical protein
MGILRTGEDVFQAEPAGRGGHFASGGEPQVGSASAFRGSPAATAERESYLVRDSNHRVCRLSRSTACARCFRSSAFVAEHGRCGELEGGVVWLGYTC